MIFTKVTDNICPSCRLCKKCWNENYIETLAAFNDASNNMFIRGKAYEEDFPLHFREKCLKFTNLLEQINQNLWVIMQKDYVHKQISESRKLVKEQYLSINSMLRQFSLNQSMATEFMPRLEELTFKYCLLFGSCDSVMVYKKNLRIYVEIYGNCIDKILENLSYFTKGLSKILSCQLNAPEYCCNIDSKKLVLRSKEPYKADISVATKKKSSSEISADCYNYFINENGKLIIILADGMGTGKDALMESSNVMKILERFLRCSVSAKDAISSILPSMKMQEIYVALDIISLDLYTGYGNILKFSTAPSFIYSKKYAKTFEESPNEPKNYGFKMEKGDKLVLISDGISLTNLEIKEMIYSSLSAKDLSNVLLAGEEDDDKTAIVLSLEKN